MKSNVIKGTSITRFAVAEAIKTLRDNPDGDLLKVFDEGYSDEIPMRFGDAVNKLKSYLRKYYQI